MGSEILLFLLISISIAFACPFDMISIQNFCIDKFEAPNILGVKPFSYQTALDGEKWCSTLSKRLCTENEWTLSCQGGKNLTYPYGNTHVPGICNEQKTWISPDWGKLGKYPASEALREADRLYQSDLSGMNDRCSTVDRVMDMTGNVAEWVRVSIPHPKNYTHVVKGCYWSGCYGGAKPNCLFRNPAHPPQFRSYEFGFRCCKSM